MNRSELTAEINRVEDALRNTTSKKLQHDYGKYLKRLHQNLKHYDKAMKQWQTNRICDQTNTN